MVFVPKTAGHIRGFRQNGHLRKNIVYSVLHLVYRAVGMDGAESNLGGASRIEPGNRENRASRLP